jgi:outer membrane protein assembly factor BamE (lipoprotein component of BamABCDE complex)
MLSPALQHARRAVVKRRGAGWPAVFVIAVALSIAGCVTAGKDFNSDAISLVKPGVTTMDEVRKMIGETIRTGIEDGKIVWTYLRYHANIVGDFDGKDLTLHFDDQNRVVGIAFNSTDTGRQLKR